VSPAGVQADSDFNFGFSAGFELRRLTERGKPGPAKVWFRQHGAVVEGEPLSPAMRAAAVGDYSNGIATELPWSDWTFINADLTISLARLPEGEWILSDAESWVAEDGTGLAMARLADERGTFGRAIQSLLIERR
jgi:Thioesterase-like superfamily